MNVIRREIVRENYNAVAQRVRAELAALDAGQPFDPTQLAQHDVGVAAPYAAGELWQFSKALRKVTQAAQQAGEG